MSQDTLRWDFPLPRCHTGIPLGNGVQGVLVWGDEALHITVSRAGFWHHNQLQPYESAATYQDVKRLVEARDEEALKSLFVGKDLAGAGKRPFQIGGGRLVLGFGGSYRPVRASLVLATATVEVVLENGAGDTLSLRVEQAMHSELAWVEGLDDAALQPVAVQLLPAWHFIQADLEKNGVTEPLRWAAITAEGAQEGLDLAGVDEVDTRGFTQTLPYDDALSVEIAYSRKSGRIVLATQLAAPEPEAGRGIAAQALKARSLADVRDANRRWWAEYWFSVPSLNLPDAELQHAYLLGLCKQAGLSTPGGVAATLQGPWMEDDAIPPWSNDYHFNINVQMVYGSVLPTNRAQHLAPLWDMVRAWFPALRRKGEIFFQRPGAMMLPHAVDDRCNVIGTFWTGTIDHACTAWVGQMAWLHYRYTLDENVLREIAWPVLTGAFEGYWAMAERIEDASSPGGTRFTIPLSVSPEYNGSALNACGRDASYQLAAFHCVAEILPRAAAVLGEPVDPRWAEVTAKLRPYTLVRRKVWAGEESRIALWDGQDLDESHRHHAHLAALWPFQTVDPHSEEHWRVVGATMRHWTKMGAGRWTGWCIPWASILCTRCGLPDAAVTWLKWWQMVFTNIGHGTLHDPDYSGTALGLCGDRSLYRPGFDAPPHYREIMQMDAAMSAIAAILELFVQSRGDTITVLLRIPKRWKDFSFEGIRTEGAFSVSGRVARGKVQSIRVDSEKGGLLRLRHSLVNGVRIRQTNGEETIVPPPPVPLPATAYTIYEADMKPGERVELRALPPL